MKLFSSMKERISSMFNRDRYQTEWDEPSGLGRFGRIIMALLALYVVIFIALGFIWSMEPNPIPIRQNMEAKLAVTGSDYVVGAATTSTLIGVAETLLDKPGGYLSNDVMPPGLYLDNIPNWEFGVLQQVRDFARGFREFFSRSQSQSVEDPDLSEGEPLFYFDNGSWIFPPSESEYRRATDYFYSYLGRIADPQDTNAQFFARADNLSSWLATVELRLGSLSQRLSASVGQDRVNTDTARDQSATQSTPTQSETRVKTPWLQVDDVFYEARGATWALMHFLRAVEVDFADVLEDKNATASVRQIIRDLEYSQRAVFFPIILNGSGFGVFANHSLTMANYVSRANAAIIDLRSLLAQG